MSHPYLLIAAVVVTVPLLVPLAHVFFGTWAQFTEEAGIGALQRNLAASTWSNLIARVASVLSTAAVDLLGLFLAYAAVLAIAYHALAWIALWFVPPY